MSNVTEDPELRKAIRDANERLEEKSEAERRAIIEQTINQAFTEELAEKRADIEREAAVVREEITRDTRAEEASRARRDAPSTILLLLLLLLILLLIAAATGSIAGLISFPGFRNEPMGPLLTVDGANRQNAPLDVLQANPGNIPAVGDAGQQTYPVGGTFLDYYNANGGERVFGLAISPEMQVNGRTIQWFERTRLEEWPEYADTPYAIQGGRLGLEFTEEVTFPDQEFFVSRPGYRYFVETGYSVREDFLTFWEENGGLTRFGFPVSEEVDERLPNGEIHRVQYFERGRLEHHPRLGDTPNEIQIGLLGRALYLNESQPDIIPPVQPTPIPMP
ncbi:MAG: hypothetical protein AAGF95_24630 [Chloroflexota bacterium]